jgi:hypothetical protein
MKKSREEEEREKSDQSSSDSWVRAITEKSFSSLFFSSHSDLMILAQSYVCVQ